MASTILSFQLLIEIFEISPLNPPVISQTIAGANNMNKKVTAIKTKKSTKPIFTAKSLAE